MLTGQDRERERTKRQRTQLFSSSQKWVVLTTSRASVVGPCLDYKHDWLASENAGSLLSIIGKLPASSRPELEVSPRAFQIKQHSDETQGLGQNGECYAT